jgi:t-SNARE complex subunit (syntaxin)
MFSDLSKLVKEQEIEVRHIYDNIEESHTKTHEAFAHIVEASKLQRDGQCIVC